MKKKKETITENVTATQRDLWSTYNDAKKRSARNRLFWTFQFIALVVCLLIVAYIEFG